MAAPTLPEELCDVIVHHMEPSTLLAALHLNKTYLRLCTSQELWRAHAERRWGQGVPPTTDYRRHYVQRSTMELGKPVLDPRDRANWGMSLLLDVLDPDSGDSVLKCCLKLADARVSDYDGEVREGLNGGFTLQWRLPDATPVMGGVGACFLWAADERMCQLTPSLANRSHGVHAHFYGEFWA